MGIPEPWKETKNCYTKLPRLTLYMYIVNRQETDNGR